MRESVELQRYALDKYYHKEILLITGYTTNSNQSGKGKKFMVLMKK